MNKFCNGFSLMYNDNIKFNILETLFFVALFTRVAPLSLVANQRCSTLRKKCRSFSDLFFPTFELNTEICSVYLRIQSECEKIRTRKTRNTDFFHAKELQKELKELQLKVFKIPARRLFSVRLLARHYSVAKSYTFVYTFLLLSHFFSKQL